MEKAARLLPYLASKETVSDSRQAEPCQYSKSLSPPTTSLSPEKNSSSISMSPTVSSLSPDNHSLSRKGISAVGLLPDKSSSAVSLSPDKSRSAASLSPDKSRSAASLSPSLSPDKSRSAASFSPDESRSAASLSPDSYQPEKERNLPLVQVENCTPKKNASKDDSCLQKEKERQLEDGFYDIADEQLRQQLKEAMLSDDLMFCDMPEEEPAISGTKNCAQQIL